MNKREGKEHPVDMKREKEKGITRSKSKTREAKKITEDRRLRASGARLPR
jgi:hypothetical protein